jgi:hypothetical protein
MPFSLKGCPSIGVFVGRSENLQTMAEYLSPTRRQKILVIHGLGGIGKTQLALEFAKIYHDRFSSTFWINGETEQTLKMGLATIAQDIPSSTGISNAVVLGDNQSVELAIKNSLRWLQRPKNSSWLLILDRIDNQVQHTQHTGTSSQSDSVTKPYDIKQYLSSFTHGTIIITTRVSSMAQLGKGLQLSELPQRESVEILQVLSPHLEATGMFLKKDTVQSDY